MEIEKNKFVSRIVLKIKKQWDMFSRLNCFFAFIPRQQLNIIHVNNVFI